MTRTVAFFNDTKHITFDPVEHVYVCQEAGLPVAGVTSILGGAVPKHLTNWAAKMASEYWVAQIKQGRTDLETIDKEARLQHRKAKEAGGTVGTDAHAFCAAALKDRRAKMPSDPVTAKACAAFLEWLRSTDVQVIEAEKIVFSKEHWYCGTTDLWGLVNKRKAVLDFKTGKDLYDEHPLQLAAYAVAIEEDIQERIDDGWIILLNKTTGKFTPYYVELTETLKQDWIEVRNSHSAITRTIKTVKEIKNGLRQQQAAAA